MDPDGTNPMSPLDGESPRRRFDLVTVLLAAATLVFVAGVIWLRLGARATPEPPTIGSTPPPLRLLNLETSEPLFLLGLKGKVVWLVFWSADSNSGKEVLPRLEDAWKTLRGNRRFTLVAAAVDSDHPQRVREALGSVNAGLPAYLVTPETRLRFGVDNADPPLHVLIDADGKVAALVRGSGRGTIHRLAAQVRGWLDDLDPLGPTRFAFNRPYSPVRIPAREAGPSSSADPCAEHPCFDVEPLMTTFVP